MNLLLTIILFTSIWCIGLTIITQPEMGLYKIRAWAENKQGEVYKPLLLCVWCMSSIHSLVGYAFAYGLGFIHVFNFRLLIMYPLVVCGASILTGFLWGMLTIIMNINHHYENLEANKYKNDPNDETIEDDEPKEHYLIKKN